ncbi:amidohydrolase family protein [Sphingomonas humi]|uniref:Amidohydrolase n=1 Tax=Sphingomonas humi TaxID=335630 RepID=A0ABP7S3Z0_9SPHN
MPARPPFVDPHVHLWDLEHVRYPWLAPPFTDDGPNGSVEAIARDYLLDDYLADAGEWDVRGIVHIDAGAHADDALRETEWLQKMADARGMPNGIVAFAALDSPNLRRLLEEHAAHANVRGIRHIVNWHPDPKRTYSASDITISNKWMNGFGLLREFGMSFDLQAYPGQLPHLASLVASHHDTQVIVDHAGMAIPHDPEGMEQWRRGLKALADLPNVAVKISGMGFSYRPWELEQVRPYVLETIDLFGTDRAMFASNFPTDKLFGSFETHLGAYDVITADFSAEERAALFGGNANRIYRLGLTL